MTLWQRLNTIHQAILIATIIVLISIPILHPVGLPVTIAQTTREVYNGISKATANDVVYVEADWGRNTRPEGSGIVAAVRYMFDKNVKIAIATTSGVDGFNEIDNMLQLSGAKDKKVYGVDYIILGAMTSIETSYASFAANPIGFYGVDYVNKQALGNYQIMKSVKTIKDFRLLLCYCFGSETIVYQVRQYAITYGTELYQCIGLNNVPYVWPYYPQYVKGVIQGAQGSAEMEILTGKLAGAIAVQDSVSLAALGTLAIIVIGNIGDYGLRRQKKAVSKISEGMKQ